MDLSGEMPVQVFRVLYEELASVPAAEFSVFFVCFGHESRSGRVFRPWLFFSVFTVSSTEQNFFILIRSSLPFFSLMDHAISKLSSLNPGSPRFFSCVNF